MPRSAVTPIKTCPFASTESVSRQDVKAEQWKATQDKMPQLDSDCSIVCCQLPPMIPTHYSSLTLEGAQLARQ